MDTPRTQEIVSTLIFRKANSNNREHPDASDVLGLGGHVGNGGEDSYNNPTLDVPGDEVKRTNDIAMARTGIDRYAP